jgi:hypothetical protein
MEVPLDSVKHNEAYVSFYNPRKGALARLGPNHFRFAHSRIGMQHEIVALLKVMEYELPDRKVVVHFGWPMSSWLDRMSIGVMVFNLMRLPRRFPNFDFHIDYSREPRRVSNREPISRSDFGPRD